VSYAESIVRAFIAFRKTAETFVFAVGMEYFPAPGQYFMAIGLVAYIPYQLIVRSIEHIVQGGCQLYYAQAGPEMAAMHAHYVNDVLAQFITYLVKLFFA